MLVAVDQASCGATSGNVQANVLATITSANIDAHDPVTASYDELTKSCLMLLKPSSSGRSFGRRTPKSLIVNRGQIATRTITLDLSAFSILSSGGAVTITLPALPAISLPVISTSSSSSSTSSSSTDIFATFPRLALTGIGGTAVIAAVIAVTLGWVGALVVPMAFQFPIVSRTYETLTGDPLSRLGNIAEERFDAWRDNVLESVRSYRRSYLANYYNHNSNYYNNVRRVDYEYPQYETSNSYNDYGNVN